MTDQTERDAAIAEFIRSAKYAAAVWKDHQAELKRNYVEYLANINGTED